MTVQFNRVFQSPNYDLIKAIYRNNAKQAQEAIAQGANVNSFAFANELSALTIAAINGNIKMIKLLLKNGADIDMQSATGKTALIEAVSAHKMNAVRMLIHCHAKLDLQDSEGNTALILACKANNTSMVKLLLEKGANKGIKDNLQKTAEIWAHYQKNQEIIDLLQARHPSTQFIMPYQLTAGNIINLHRKTNQR